MGAGLESRLDWVASYPKSGNTWLRLLIGSYLNDRVAFYDDVSRYFYQTASPYPLAELNLWQEVQLRSAALLHVAVAADNEQTIVKTHHAMCEIGGLPLFAPAFVRKAIYVIRDPRDVAASMVYHFGMSQGEVIELMADPQARLSDDDKMSHVLSSWSLHVASWTQSDRVPTICTQYEKLHADPVGELRKIVTFMGWPVREAQLVAAVEANQFDKLQAEEKARGFSEKSEKAELFFRRGQVGAWREELDGALAREIEKRHGDVMKQWDYQPGPKLALAH